MHCGVQARHKRRVNCELGTAPKTKTVGDDLDAPLVLPLDNKVEVTQEHVGRDSGPGLTAHPSSGSLEWDSSRAQQTGAWVTQSIEAAPARAECRDQGQLRRLKPSSGEGTKFFLALTCIFHDWKTAFKSCFSFTGVPGPKPRIEIELPKSLTDANAFPGGAKRPAGHQSQGCG